MRSNKKRRRAGLAVATGIFVCLVAAGGAVAAKKAESPPEVTHDGLHLVPGTEMAAVWVKPGADFSGYDRIMLLDAYVAFRKGWERDQRRGSIHKVTSRDVERIKRETAALFREVFVEELDTKGGYPVVDSAETDVLLLRPGIIDLDVTAPDLNTTSRSYNFAASAGAATLYLEFYDSVSGEILARAVDRKAARDRGNFMQWSNKVTNLNAAKEILRGWAGILRSRLDEIHAEGAAEEPDGE